MHGLVLAKRGQQIAKGLDGNVEGANGWRERDENGMRRPARVAERRAPAPTSRAVRARARDRRPRRPDRRPSGNRRRRCRNAGAGGAAAARRPRENFRSDAWPASACSARLRATRAAGRRQRARDFEFGRCLHGARARTGEPGAAWKLRADARRYGNHRDFHLAVAMLHVLEHRGKLAQRNFRVDEIARANFAARNGFQRLADEARRVVERGLDGDLGIVQRRRDRSAPACRAGSRRTD